MNLHNNSGRFEAGGVTLDFHEGNNCDGYIEYYPGFFFRRW